MLGSLKRRSIERGRAAAAIERVQAARDLVAAMRAAEAAIEAIKAANDKFYLAEHPTQQLAFSDMRRDRERLFAFYVTTDLIAESPRFARILGLKVAAGRQMPLVAWVAHTTHLDLGEAETNITKGD